MICTITDVISLATGSQMPPIRAIVIVTHIRIAIIAKIAVRAQQL